MNPIRRFWAVAQFLRRNGGVKGASKLAQAAPKYLALYKSLLADPRVPKSAKAALIGAGAFAVSPLNIPNFIPVVGALDDLGVLMLAHGYFLKQVPENVLSEARTAVGLTDDLP